VQTIQGGVKGSYISRHLWYIHPAYAVGWIHVEQPMVVPRVFALEHSFFTLVLLTLLTHYCMPRAKIQNKQDLCIHPQKRYDPLSDYTNHD
jgi:hypothetical protein